MKNTLLLILLFAGLNADAQAPFIRWQKSFGGTQDEAAGFGNKTITTPDGGFIMAGQTLSLDGQVTVNHDQGGNGGYGDVWVVKTDSLGSIIWQKSYGSDGPDAAQDIVRLPDGGYIIAATAGASTPSGDVTFTYGGLDFWVIRIDSVGNLLWQKNYGGSVDDIANAVTPTSDGGFVVAGRTSSQNNGLVSGIHSFNSDMWVIKIDSLGTFQWQRTLGGFWQEEAFSVCETFDGSYAVFGITGSNDGNVSGNHGGSPSGDCWLVKLSPLGVLQWQKCYGGNNEEAGADILETPADSGFIMVGRSQSNSGQVTGNHGSAFDVWVVKTDQSGNLLWQKCYGGSAYDNPSSIKALANGDYIIGASSGSSDGDVSFGHGNDDYWALRITSTGTLLWEKTFGGLVNDRIGSVDAIADGNFIITGSSRSTDGDVTGNIGNQDMWVVRTGPCVDAETPVPTAAIVNICIGDTASLSVASGNLNSSQGWVWYIDACGNGIPVGSGNSIFVNPTSTTTYYVRGEGGCTAPGICASVTVNVHDLPLPIAYTNSPPLLSPCFNDSIELIAGSVAELHYADTVITFSSEYTFNTQLRGFGVPYSATQVLGAPDVYPNYSDNSYSWSPLSQDDQREFIELGFYNPTPINFIDIYETYAPGSVDTVYIKNPNTNQFEVVYAASAGPQPLVARIMHVAFPLTTFPVSEIRIAMNSPAVFDWNEIDAVSIGRIVQGGYAAYSWTGDQFSASTPTAFVSNPQIYTVTVTDSNGCTGNTSIQIVSSEVNLGPDVMICPEDGHTIGAANCVSYLWSTGETTSSIFVNPTSQTTYTCTGTDALGCVTTDDIIIYTYPVLDHGTVTVVNSQCYGYSNGSISIGPVSGGYIFNVSQRSSGYIARASKHKAAEMVNTNTASRAQSDYSFVLSGNDFYQNNNTGVFTDLYPATYYLSVTDDAGCGFDTTIVITSPGPVQTFSTPAIPLICDGGTLDIILSATGGTPPYTFNGDTTAGLVANSSYFYSATDVNGCTGSILTVEPVDGNHPAEPIIISSQSVTVCSGDSTVLSASAVDGSAIYFDGVDDYVEGVNGDLPLYYYNQITLEAWIKPAGTQTGVIYSWGSSSAAANFALMYKDQKLTFSSNASELQGTTVIDTGKWTHVAVEFNPYSGTMTLFVNGVVEVSQYQYIYLDQNNFRIGASSMDAPSTFFKGTIDEIRVWNYARSNTQIVNSMNQPVSSMEGGLVGYYTFDADAGTTVVDSCLNGYYPHPGNYDGTLYGGALHVSSPAPGYIYNTYLWSPGGQSTSSIYVASAGNYDLTVSNSTGCYSTSTVTIGFQACIIPYYPPTDSGKSSNILGSELTQLYYNQDTIQDAADSSNLIFLINSDSVLIEVIVNQGKYDDVLALLQTPPYGMTDFITNGIDTFIITGKYPIANLLKLDSLGSLINYVRPYYPPVAATSAVISINTGLAYSKGDQSMKADSARLVFGVTGAGIKVGVISDSYNTVLGNYAPIDVINGDLPGSTVPGNPKNVQVLKEYPYGRRTDEGRAMMQIVHDVAPDAKLAFRTGFVSAGDFAQGIKELRDDSCDIIVDDVTFITEPFFQDGVVAKAVDKVTADGATYFSAAGNYGSKSYTGTFTPVAAPAGFPASARAHNFGGGDIYQHVILPPGTYTIVLQWEDSIYSMGQYPGTRNDLDIYLVDNGGNKLFGFNRKNNWGDPIEVLPFTVKGNADASIMVVRTWGNDTLDFKYVVFRGEMTIDEFNQGNSTIVGQANATGAIAVGAVLYTNTPRFGVNPPTIASFSSHGGTEVYGVARNKPDIVAPNGVSTTVNMGNGDFDGDGQPNFFGTSCSAPHAAGVAALIAQGKKKFYSQTVLPSELKNIMTSTALNMDVAGPDLVTGSGLILADEALSSFASPTPIANKLTWDTTLTPGVQPLLISVKGAYFKPSSYILFRGDSLPTNVMSSSLLTAEVPAFIGNPTIAVKTPPITPNQNDGGVSDTLYFFSTVKKLVHVKADNKSKMYGATLPVFTSTITVDGVPLDSTELSAADLDLDNIIYTCGSTNSNDNVGNYFIGFASTPAVITDSVAAGLSEIYTFTYQNGVLSITPMPLTIIPNDTTIIYGDPIEDLTFTYIYPDSVIPSGNQAAFLNDIKIVHHSEMSDVLAVVDKNVLVNGRALVNHDLENLGMLSSERALLNGRALVNPPAIVNNILVYDLDTTHVVDVAVASVFKYQVDDDTTTLFAAGPQANSTALVNARALVNGAAIVNGRALVNAPSGIINSSSLGDSTEDNNVIIIDSLDAYAPPNDTLYIFKSINMVTGTTPGVHTIVPGSMISNNFTITYGLGTLIITKDTLTIDVQDTAITCNQTPVFRSVVSGLNYDDTDSTVFSGGINYTIYNASSQQVLPGSFNDGTYSVVASVSLQDTNYILKYLPGTLTVTGCQADADGDGYNSTVDCNDNNAAIHPGAVEICNGVDDDCNGLVDDVHLNAGPINSAYLSACIQASNSGGAFSVPAIPGATYLWTVPTGLTIINGQGTNSIFVTWTTMSIHNGVTGPMCVHMTLGCATADVCAKIDINGTKPVSPGSISGPAKVCPGDTVVYSISLVSRATSYTWALPSGITIVDGNTTN
ncbi:MAG: LamG-like jellyroll fold domain-containing protein, partial [Bacteroidota bacterium]